MAAVQSGQMPTVVIWVVEGQVWMSSLENAHVMVCTWEVSP